ncbi:MAG: sugar phosphate isomerase/epimerase [Clostridia bacterium]|nr:sugar phosphate isomerase/epimerase [Clostridia bacterium]
MKLSVSSYSFQQYINSGKLTQVSCIEKAKEMGFEGIEFIDLSPKAEATLDDQLAYAEEIRAEANRVGIEIVAYTVGANLYRPDGKEADAEVERLCGQVRVAAALGAKLMRHDVCYWGKSPDGRVMSFDQMLPVMAKNARRVTEYAQTLGIRTCSENHGYTAQDSDRVERLYNAVNHPNYGLLVDIGNFACVDEDSVTAVSRLAPYAIHAHAKDFIKRPFGLSPANSHCLTTRGMNTLVGCAIGEGDIPVEQCVAILRRAGYDGFLSVEYEGTGDCIEGIAKGLENLKTYVSRA